MNYCLQDSSRIYMGVVLKQLNYYILILPILFRSVDRTVNDLLNESCRSCKFTQCLWFNQLVMKKRLLINKNLNTKNLQIIKLYTFYLLKRIILISCSFRTVTYFCDVLLAIRLLRGIYFVVAPPPPRGFLILCRLYPDLIRYITNS